MISDKVVARFKDGKLIKGTARSFISDKKGFKLELINGEIKDIDIEKLKALFYVKTFEGNKNYLKIYTDVIPEAGRRLIVEFNDGEIIVGYSRDYSPDVQGFFLIPADIKSNNERIYVVTSATKSIFLSERKLEMSVENVMA